MPPNAKILSFPCLPVLRAGTEVRVEDYKGAHVILRVAFPCRKPNCQPLWRWTMGKSSISDTMGFA